MVSISKFTCFVLLLLLCISSTCFSAGGISGLITDPFGKGLYEQEIFACKSGASANSVYWRCYTNGYYELMNLSSGTYTLGLNDPFCFRPRLRSFVPIKDGVTSTGNIRIRTTYFVQGFVGGTPYCTEIWQSFKSTGGCVTKVTVWMLEWENLEVSIHDLATGAQIGPKKISGEHDRGTAKWLWGEVPLTKGSYYYVKLRKPNGSTFRTYCDDKSGGATYPDGQAYYNGTPAPGTDLTMSIECDDDGLATMYYRPTNTVGFYGGNLGQTFRARGSNITLVCIWATGFDSGTDVTFSIHEGGPTGAQVGVSKTIRVYNYQPMAQWAVCSWQPGEVPVTSGNTYYLKMVSSGIYLWANGNNPYPDGTMYVGGSPQSSTDICATIMGEVTSGSSTCTIQGTVRDSNGTPVVGATISTANFGYTTTSGTGGTYSLIVTGDVYDITCAKSGYFSSTVTGFNAECGTVKTLDFTISLPGTVSGYVRSTGGTAIEGATVVFNPGNYSAVTTSTGYYTITNLVPGTYTAVASRPGYQSQTKTVVIKQGSNSCDFALAEQTSLINPGFETGNLTGWTGYGHSFGVVKDVGFGGITPHSGRYHADMAASWTDPKVGGAYQRVAVTPGVPVTGTAYTNCYGEGEGYLHTFSRIGMDPTGGTNPNAATVQWSPWYRAPRDFYREWVRLSKTVTPIGGWVTLFLDYYHEPRGQYAWPWQVNAFDDASLGPGYGESETIASAKQEPEGMFVYCGPGIITAKFSGTPNSFYIEDTSRATGIRVEGTTVYTPGDMVKVAGIVRTANGERYIEMEGVDLIQAGVGIPKPLGMNNLILGGGSNGEVPGLDGNPHVNNLGLLVKVWGRVTSIDSTSFSLNDGSGVNVKVVVPSGVTVPANGKYAVVTGISSTYNSSGIKRLVKAIEGGIVSY